MKLLREEVKNQTYKTGVFDFMDGSACQSLNITMPELNLLTDKCTDEELEMLLQENLTFTDRRKALEIRNKYIAHYGCKE